MSSDPGILYYANEKGNFLFPAAVTVSVRQRPVESENKQVAKYMSFNILVEVLLYPGCDDVRIDADPNQAITTRKTPLGDIYYPKFPYTDSTTDDGIEEVRRILSYPGGLLYYKDKGMGNDFFFRGNSFNQQIPVTIPQGGFIDTTFGPKTRLAVFEPVGGNKCTRLIWEVEVKAPDCYPAARNDLTDFSYNIQWAIDHCGLTQRTVTGKYEVPLERRLNRLSNNADSLRDRVFGSFPIPVGFRRNQNYTLSPDRRTLDFSIIDKEIDSPNHFKQHCCEMEVKETIKNRMYLVESKVWSVNISGRIRTAPGREKWWAWLAFADIVNRRVFPATQDRFVGGYDARPLPKKGIIIDGLRISEDIYAREMQFSLSYWFTSELKDVFLYSGMWVPINHDNTQAWNVHMDSMTRVRAGGPNPGAPWGPRGVKAMFQHVNDDIIISLCDFTEGPALPQARTQTDPPAYPGDVSGGDTDGYLGKGYISFQHNANLYEETKAIANQPIGGASKTSQQILDSWPTGPEETTGTGIIKDTNENNKRPHIHYRGVSNWKVDFSGSAMRANKPIPRVGLVSYAGKKAIPVGDMSFETKEINGIDNTIIYLARWSGTYQLDGAPEQGKDLLPYPRTGHFA